MQQLLASLVVALSVKDAAFEAGMSNARREAARTGQDIEKSADRMEGAIVRMARSVDRAMVAMVDTFESARQKVIRAGAAMTVGLTAPILLAGKAAKDTASDFEAAMNGVRASMIKASPDQIKSLSDAAKTMGPQFGKSASEAANAIDGLAKAGLSASDILNGGLKSALTLAVVGQTDLGRATAITTDIMSQFHRQAGDLPAITDRVVGALDATKLAANDYAQAIGQVGGIAGGLGYSFEDTNVAISALAPAFDSGSSAGTALKSMLLQLKPTTKDAEKVMERLGKATIGQSISFFDANDKAKTFAETAEILRKTFGRLNDESKREALTKAFGSDGMAAAIALMDKGAAGMEDMRQAIDSVTAGEKLAVLMQGDAKASDRLAKAVEALSIALGDVLLPIFTSIKNAAASAIEWLAGLPPVFHQLWVWTGVVVAALGPLVTALGVLAPAAIALFAGRLLGLPLLIGALINPISLLIGVVGRLAVAMGASAAIGLFAARLATMASGIGLVIGIASILIPLLFRTAAASDAARASQEAANAAMERARDRTMQLATATGKLREEIIAKAREDGKAAAQALKSAVADMAKARAALVRARAEAAAQNQAAVFAGGSAAGPAAGAMMRGQADAKVRQAEAELRASSDAVRGFATAVQSSIAAIKSPDPAAGGGLAVNFDDPAKQRKGPKGRDAARDEAAYLDELGRLRVQALEAHAEVTGLIEARYDAEIAAIQEDRASFARNVALDEGLTDAKRASLIAAQDAVLKQRELQVEQAQQVAIDKERYGLQLAALEAEQDAVRSQIDAADSVAGRRAGQLRLLALERRHEEAVLDQILATEKSTSLEWQNAQIRKEQLDAVYSARETTIRRDNGGPLDQYRRDLNRSAEAVNESIEAIQVSGFERLNDWMTDAVMGADNLAKAFSNMAKSIIADLVRIMIQQQLIKPLANALGGGLGSLFGGGAAGVQSLLGPGNLDLGNALPAFQSSVGQLAYGGGKASGGRVSAGSWYMVGENGPEPFIPDGNGTIMPNRALKGAPMNLRVALDVNETPNLRITMREEANNASTAVSLDSTRRQAKAQRRQMGTGGR